MVGHGVPLYFCSKKELPGDLTRDVTRCPKGEKWTSRTVVKINVIVYLEYICIDRNIPAFLFSLWLFTAVSEIMSYLTDEGFFMNLPSRLLQYRLRVCGTPISLSEGRH